MGKLFEVEFGEDGLGDGFLVDYDVHGLGEEVGFGYVEVAVVNLIGVPRVLDLVVFVAFLVNCLAYDNHAVVVGGFLTVEHLLT